MKEAGQNTIGSIQTQSQKSFQNLYEQYHTCLRHAKFDNAVNETLDNVATQMGARVWFLFCFFLHFFFRTDFKKTNV